MAGEWIKMRIRLGSDPAVISIGESLDMDEYAVVGRLHAIWAWADEHTTDGNAPAVTEKWIDRYLNAPGFARAMQEAGWLCLREGGVEFPNFDSHNGQSGKQRSLAAKRVSLSRSKKCAISNAPIVTSALPREEKRREDTKGVNPLKPPGEVSEAPEVKPKAPPKAITIDQITIPEPLDTPVVRAALTDWIAYKKKQGHPYREVAYVERLLGTFTRDGPEEFLAAVDHSIGNTYQGLVRPKPHERKNTRPGPGQTHDPARPRAGVEGRW